MDGYAKKDLANITPNDLQDYRKLAGIMLAYSESELLTAVSLGKVLEVRCDEVKKVS